MFYVHRYQTEAEFTSAYTGEGYSEPWLSATGNWGEGVESFIGEFYDGNIYRGLFTFVIDTYEEENQTFCLYICGATEYIITSVETDGDVVTAFTANNILFEYSDSQDGYFQWYCDQWSCITSSQNLNVGDAIKIFDVAGWWAIFPTKNISPGDESYWEDTTVISIENTFHVDYNKKEGPGPEPEPEPETA